jgi:uncharacterized cupredoxin-like copper-binding protein
MTPARGRHAAGAALLALLCACGSGDDGPRLAEGPPGEEIAVATADAPMDTTPAGTPAPPEGAALEGGARLIAVTLREWDLTLSPASVPAGAITLHATNRGEGHHAIAVQRVGTDPASGRIPAGASGSLDVELEPGTYEVYCPLEEQGVLEDGRSHSGRGMRATLTVTD